MREAAVGAGHLREAVNEVTLARRGDAGELRIGLMASLASGFLGNLVARFHARYPHVDLKLEEITSRKSAAGILSGRLDVAFIPGQPRLPGCQSRSLWEERIFVAMSESHRLAMRDAIAWEDVQQEKFLVTAEGPGPEIEDHIVRELSAPGFRPRISVQRVGRENLLNMVAKGLGISLTTHSTLGVSYPGAEFRPIGDTAQVVSSSAVWSDGNRNPALKRLLELAILAQRQSANRRSS